MGAYMLNIFKTAADINKKRRCFFLKKNGNYTYFSWERASFKSRALFLSGLGSK